MAGSALDTVSDTPKCISTAPSHPAVLRTSHEPMSATAPGRITLPAALFAQIRVGPCQRLSMYTFTASCGVGGCSTVAGSASVYSHIRCGLQCRIPLMSRLPE